MKFIIDRLNEPSTKLALAFGIQWAKSVPALAPYAQAADVLTGLLLTHTAVTPDQPAAKAA